MPSGQGQHHGEVGEQSGWAVDPSSLREVLTDRRRVEQALPAAEPVQRLFLLGLLGQTEQGLAEGRRLLDDPGIGADPWLVLLRLADLLCQRADFAGAERCHQVAWRHALGRERQASTLHWIGVRQFEQGDRTPPPPAFSSRSPCSACSATPRNGPGRRPRWRWREPAPGRTPPSTR